MKNLFLILSFSISCGFSYALEVSVKVDGKEVDPESVVLELGDGVSVTAEAVTSDGSPAQIQFAEFSGRVDISDWSKSIANYSYRIGESHLKDGYSDLKISYKDYDKKGYSPNLEIDGSHSIRLNVKTDADLSADQAPAQLTRISVNVSKKTKDFNDKSAVSKGDASRKHGKGEKSEDGYFQKFFKVIGY